MKTNAYQVWQEKLSGFSKSKVSFAEFCRRNKLQINTAYGWKRRLRLTKNQSYSSQAEIDNLEFIEIKLQNNEPKTSGVSLELGELKITLDSDFNLTTLKKVLSIFKVV